MSTTSAGPKFPQKTLARMTTQNPKKPPRQGATLAAEKSRGSAPPLLVLRKVTEILNCFSAVAETRHVVMRPFLVGQVMPIHAGAPGKIFLAFDPEARQANEDTELTRYTPQPRTPGRNSMPRSAVPAQPASLRLLVNETRM